MSDSRRADGRQVLDVAIIGAGLGGLIAAAKLKQAGISRIAIFERAEKLGGVWRANRYPNVACDTPIDLYGISFFPGDKWSTNFAPGSEIWDYLNDFAREFDLLSLIETRTEIARTVWNESNSTWLLEASDSRRWASRHVVWAGGLLSRPSIPNVSGKELFQGEQLHTTDWNDNVRLEGKSVAVVGGGATSIQVVPYAARHAEKAYVFVRTPSYVLPRPDLFFGRVARESPGFAERQRERREQWFRRFEKIAEARFPMNDKLIAEQEAEWRASFDTQVKDGRLREILTPNYRFGCKRPLFSNDYYPALTCSNVMAVGQGISRVERNAVVDANGDAWPVDTIIWATGFDPVNMMGRLEIVGRNGRSLAELWSQLPEAYFGTLVKGFPNLFLINGPNVGGASATDFIEGQAELIVDAIASVTRQGATTVEVSADLHDTFNAGIQRRANSSVLVLGNCSSWYRAGGDGGVFTHWPGTIEAFRAELARDARGGLIFGGQKAEAHTEA